MTFDNLPTLITLLIALSVATERVVEIVKGFFWQLNEAREDPRLEAKRRFWLHLLAVGGGIAVTLAAWPAVREVVPGTGDWTMVAALGLLASGGSGFWNTILSYVLKIKDLRKEDLRAAQQGASGRAPLRQPSEGTLAP
jgi:hypothetical protein